MSSSSKPGLLNPTAACTPTTKITPTTTITRAARTRTEQEAGKQGKGKSARAQSGRAVLTGSNWGYGVRRCHDNSDSVSVNANRFPHALGFRDCRCTCHPVIDPRVGYTDPDMLCQPESSSVNGYMVFGVCPMPWLLFYYYYYFFFIFFLGDQLLEEFPRKRKSNFWRDPSFFLILIMFFFISFLWGIIFWVNFFSDLCYTWRVFFSQFCDIENLANFLLN
jgi:hypothetical protein